MVSENPLQQGWLKQPLNFYGQGQLRLEPKAVHSALDEYIPTLGTTVKVQLSGDAEGAFLLGAFHERTDGMLEEMANVLAARLVYSLAPELDLMISPPQRLNPAQAASSSYTHCFTLWHEEGASRTPLFAAVQLSSTQAGHA
jgi:hypothetical protein